VRTIRSPKRDGTSQATHLKAPRRRPTRAPARVSVAKSAIYIAHPLDHKLGLRSGCMDSSPVMTSCSRAGREVIGLMSRLADSSQIAGPPSRSAGDNNHAIAPTRSP
jgi:hypothetical protein